MHRHMCPAFCSPCVDCYIPETLPKIHIPELYEYEVLWWNVCQLCIYYIVTQWNSSCAFRLNKRKFNVVENWRKQSPCTSHLRRDEGSYVTTPSRTPASVYSAALIGTCSSPNTNGPHMSECCPSSPQPPGRINASKQCAVIGGAQCQCQLYPVKVRVNIFPHATKWDKSRNAGSAGGTRVLTLRARGTRFGLRC